MFDHKVLVSIYCTTLISFKYIYGDTNMAHIAR